MTLAIIVCAEDSLASDVATRLLDRVVAERASAEWLRDLWLDPTTRDAQRRVVDLDAHAGWSSLSHIKEVERRGRSRVHPRDLASNRALVGSAAIAYKCVRLAPAATRVLLLAFDADHRPDHERCRAGVDAAVRSASRHLTVLVAEAHPEFDAWVIAGFVPASRRDHDELATVRTSLRNAGHTFDPLAEPHRLTSTISDDPRDAKQLCATLLGLSAQAHFGEPAVQQCIDALPLSASVAAALGLTAFVDDIVRGVLPLLGDPPQRDH